MSITLILGPVLAGKTSHLIRGARRVMLARRKPLLLAHPCEVDEEYSITSHSNMQISAFPTKSLFDTLDIARTCDWIGIDNGHFFEDIAQFAVLLAEEGKDVVVSALNADFNQQIFPHIIELIPHCDDVQLLKTICCDCKSDAFCSQRNSSVLPNDDVLLPGTGDQHSPICYKCANKDTEVIGELTMVVGPMFAGKSTSLIDYMTDCDLRRLKHVTIKYDSDCRYFDNFHIGTHDADITLEAIPVSTLGTAHEYIVKNGIQAIGVDEGQFFPDVVEYVTTWLKMGIDIIVVGLDGTFNKDVFGTMLNLIPLCVSFTKINSICHMCHDSAPFSRRLCESDELIIIGGADKYCACCRSCYSKTLDQKQLDDLVERLSSPLVFKTPSPMDYREFSPVPVS
ncbi:hypothetical protein PCE1_001481 [Barthelona sp. PCE]